MAEKKLTSDIKAKRAMIEPIHSESSVRRQGYAINHKRVQRLMRLMGLQAIYPKRRTTVPAKGHLAFFPLN
jgi:hypothetical protein